MDWYYLKDGKPVGPVPGEKLRELVAGGHVLPETELRRGDGMRWVSASSVVELWTEETTQPSPDKNSPEPTYQKTETQPPPKKFKFGFGTVFGILFLVWCFLLLLLCFGIVEPFSFVFVFVFPVFAAFVVGFKCLKLLDRNKKKRIYTRLKNSEIPFRRLATPLVYSTRKETNVHPESKVDRPIDERILRSISVYMVGSWVECWQRPIFYALGERFDCLNIDVLKAFARLWRLLLYYGSEKVMRDGVLVGYLLEKPIKQIEKEIRFPKLIRAIDKCSRGLFEAEENWFEIRENGIVFLVGTPVVMTHNGRPVANLSGLDIENVPMTELYCD